MFTTNNPAILLATFNGERFLAEQIKSLLSQSSSNWDLYIHDDGSSDNTGSIIRDYSEKYPLKIHVVEGIPTGNAKNNFFYLLRNVKAPYYFFCDQDDYWEKNKIEAFMRRTREVENSIGAEKPILVFSDLAVTDEKLTIISKSMNLYQKLDPMRISFKEIMVQNVVTGCASMINRSCAEKALEANTFDNIIMHDWWCALVAAYFGKISYIDNPLTLYRQHQMNSVGAKNAGSISYSVHRLLQVDEIRKSLDLTRMQAGKFSDVYGLDSNCIAKEYSNLSSRNKLQRLSFYKRNAIKKSGLSRNIGLFLLG